MLKNKTTLIKSILAISLVTVPIIWRILNHNNNFAPNLEFITVSAVLGSIMLGKRAAIIIPLTAIIISDLIIGNSSIFVFTWGSFILIGAGAIILNKFNRQPTKQIIGSTIFAVSSTFVFFAITNFGVWAQGWYPATLTGLMTSYTMAIPFYRTMLIGNLIIVPCAVTVWQIAKNHQTIKSLVVNTLISK